MSAKTLHFKVDNGDMALVELESGRRVLVDIRIRTAADDPEDDTPDVGAQLRERLEDHGRDDEGRLYVDAFLLTHPDQDHCAGLQTHFHLGSPSTWKQENDKILIREMWSSPIVFRRADRKTGNNLCADAMAWRTEARRRVALFKSGTSIGHGDRIKILGEDVDDKTEGLDAILVRAGATFATIAGSPDATFSGLLLAPILAEDEEEAELLSKNDSSVVLRMTIAADGMSEAAKYLFGGDAEVAIWERLWNAYAPEDLKYDVLVAPHHCSWHSLSWDSWSEKGERAEVSQDARSALAQAGTGATILACSLTLEDDEDYPPCIRAAREYKAIVRSVSGVFTCLADESGVEPHELTINRYGHKPGRRRLAAGAGYATGVGNEPLGHG